MSSSWRLKNRSRDAFLARRLTPTKKPKSSRELRTIPHEWKTAFEESDRAEWSKWLHYDAVELPTQEEIEQLDPANVLPFGWSETDKNEGTRGDKSYDEHPLKAKSRGVVPGYKDPQLLKGELTTDAPTLTAEATSIILQEAASNGWDIQAGDVDSAFLNGRYLDKGRVVFFKAPKGGLPAVPEKGWDYIPEGTILKAKMGIYGLNDAPLLWYLEHRDTILSLPLARRSKLCPALFYFRNDQGKLIGLIGIHVDDDLITGTPEFFDHHVKKLRKLHCYGKWQTGTFTHCGRKITRHDDGTIVVDQRDYAASIEPITLTAERRRHKDAPATPREREELRTGNGKISWLVRSSRMDLAFRLAESQTRANDSELKVKDLIAFNKIVSDAKAATVEIIFRRINLDNATIIAIGDASFGNIGKNKTSSQGGLIIMLADNTDNILVNGGKATVTPMVWKSHRIKRVVRSTLAAETMAANEAVEHADLLRAHLVELHGTLTFQEHLSDTSAVPVIHLTDCKSLYDLLHKRGTIPSERRLQIDVEALRESIEYYNVTSRWCNTKQMLADCLTKDDPNAVTYLRHVLRNGKYGITQDHDLEKIIAETKSDMKRERTTHFKEKYPRGSDLRRTGTSTTA